MAHTPLPWKRAKYSFGSVIQADAATHIGLAVQMREAGKYPLDTVARTDWGREAEDEDNAEYIQRACNGFEPLLELTESLLKYIENYHRGDNDTQEVMRQVRIALNRVKESYGNRGHDS